MMATSKDLFSVLSRVYNTRWSDDVEAVLLRPPGSGVRHSYVDALDALAGVGLQADMLPLAIVDDHSVACVALNDRGNLQRGQVWLTLNKTGVSGVFDRGAGNIIVV